MYFKNETSRDVYKLPLERLAEVFGAISSHADAEYLDAARCGFPFDALKCERLEERARAVEFAILALRTRWGINKSEFAARWGDGLMKKVEGVLSSLPPKLIRDTRESVALTPAGMRVGNAVWSELMDLQAV